VLQIEQNFSFVLCKYTTSIQSFQAKSAFFFHISKYLSGGGHTWKISRPA